MGSDSLDKMENIQSLIGLAVSSLLKSGKKVGTQEKLTILREEESKSVDGRKKLYGRAIRFVADGTK